MHEEKKELGYELSKIACQKERDPWNVQGKDGKIE